jgi:hypothetical protein
MNRHAKIEALARHVAKKAALENARGEGRKVQSFTSSQIAALAEAWLKDHPEIRDAVKAKYADILK